MSRLIYQDSRIGQQCRDCPDRKIEPVNCHTICEKYLEATRVWQEYKHNINDARKKDAEYDKYKSKRVGETKEYAKKHRPKH